jgi:hypothetical protein
MWQLYALQALDIANERRREAKAIALARQVAEFNAGERRGHRNDPATRVNVIRRLIAASLRGLGSGAGSVARAASATAARVDGCEA